MYGAPLTISIKSSIIKSSIMGQTFAIDGER